MKIISNFKDYYDSVQQYGQDSTVLYIRKTLEFKNKDNIPNTKLSGEIIREKILELFRNNNSKYTWRNSNYLSVNTTVHSKTHKFKIVAQSPILFCGEIYNGITIEKEAKNTIELKNTTFIYSYEQLKNYMEQNEIDLTIKIKVNYYASQDEDNFHVNFKNFFNPPNVEQKKENLKNWCIENKIICASIDENNITINPILKNIEFMKALDPWNAFQKLETWIDGRLSFPQNIMVEIEDKYKILEHGFDPEYGFRKRPK